MARDAGRYTAGRLDADLRRIIRAIVEFHAAYGTELGNPDRRLQELRAIRSIRWALDAMVDRTIVNARRDDPRLSWREIGEALGMTGQAVGQHARAKQLAVDPLSEADLERIIREAQALRRGEGED
jgi:hypothetical protein